jgi:hypothetical protein
MHVARALRLLSLPAAIVLGPSAALGCSSGGPTSPVQDRAAPSFAVTKGPVDDAGGFTLDKKSCPGGYSLVNDPTNPADVNGNGWICERNGGGGPKK